MSEALEPHPDDEVARRALPEYGFGPDADLRRINLSENATYLVSDASGGREGILRVHREDYHDPAAIRSELAWLDALREDDGIRTPAVHPAPDGRRVVTVPPVDADGSPRHTVLFERMGGLEPDETRLCDADFTTLGALTARLHQHARGWRRPADFTRFSWDWEHTLGARPRWGRWQDGIGIGPEETAVLTRVVDLLHDRLAAYGDGPERYGLVHADLRLANLLVDGEHTNVIDFDDCGFSWYLYDFGTAVSFLEDDPHLGQWQAAWVQGYREVAPLSAEDEEMLASFVLLRRLLLVAWMGSHAHSREVQSKGPDYARGSCELAERFLSSGGRTL